MGIYNKLHQIQKSVNGLGKDKSGNGFQYVTGNKVLTHVKPLMKSLGVLLKQEIISIENTRQDYVVGVNKDNPAGRPKSEILAKVMMRFTWVDVETGEKDENLFGANGQNGWDKGIGSALTYGERYFLLKYFHISTDEDDLDNPAIDVDKFNDFLENGSLQELIELGNDFELTSDQNKKVEKLISEMKLEKYNDSISLLNGCKTLAELADAYKSLDKEHQKLNIKLKDELKTKLK